MSISSYHYKIIIPLVMLTLFATLAFGPAAYAAPRAAVARLEVALDPFSLGPLIVRDLSSRSQLAPYESELARRLRLGSSGACFFVNEDGVLVTNAHVLLGGIRDSRLPFTWAQWDSLTALLSGICHIWVTLDLDGQTHSYLAEPIAIAEDLDLALLRLLRPPDDDTPFPFLPLADSDALPLGAPIQALGFPENDYQETSGQILSLIHNREVHGPMQLARQADPETGKEILLVHGSTPGPIVRLQHSAPTARGSSGGPIVDHQGNVVGVAFALLWDRHPGEEAAAAGLNLAIASNVIARLLQQHSIPFTRPDP